MNIQWLGFVWYNGIRVEISQTAQLDPDSFAHLFEAARPTLRVVAASECGFDYADDLVQQGAVVALEQLNRFTPGTNFVAWTAAIVRGLARNQRRSENRKIKHRPRLALFIDQVRKSQPTSENPSRSRPTDSFPEIEIPEEFDSKLRDALSTLSPEQRTCLLLKSLLEHSYSEIGTILDMPPTTARSHVYRARAQLLSQLQPEDERSTP